MLPSVNVNLLKKLGMIHLWQPGEFISKLKIREEWDPYSRNSYFQWKNVLDSEMTELIQGQIMHSISPEDLG